MLLKTIFILVEKSNLIIYVNMYTACTIIVERSWVKRNFGETQTTCTVTSPQYDDCTGVMDARHTTPKK
jgi:hypothetical protein